MKSASPPLEERKEELRRTTSFTNASKPNLHAGQRPPASRRRYALTKSNVREHPARQAGACHAGCFARPNSNALPLRAIGRVKRNQCPPPSHAPGPLRSGAFTMQQSRQPPLNPAAGTPAATIGMRPATSLRTKAKSVNGLLRAVGRRGFSYASSAARVPTALKMLSQKKCERASSGR